MIRQAEDCPKGKEWLSCRDVLWLLVFSGFAMTGIMEGNLSLTIVAMVIPRPEAVAQSKCKYEVQLSSSPSDLWVNTSSVASIKEYNVTPDSTLENSHVQYPNRFIWNEYEQSLALGGIAWLQWATQLPGGYLAHRYGTKFIFGLANLGTALLGFLLPFCARYHLYAFVFVRVLQGFFAGFVYPAMHSMTAKWIPVHERNKFISTYIGTSVGLAIICVLSAVLTNWFGWEAVFHVTSALGVIWCIAWYYLAYDTPEEHPRISTTEKIYIFENLEHSVNDVSSQSVPWKAILTSGPLWLTAIVGLGGNWGLFTLVYEAPSYFNYVHGWNIGAASIFSAVPHVTRMLFSYVFSRLADWLLQTEKMSTTNVRKFAMLVSNGIQGMLLLGLAYSGCHPILAIVFIILIMTVSGSISAGFFASCIDLSPNYGSMLLGITNAVSWGAGFTPFVVGTLINNNQTLEQWRLVFLITAAVPLSTVALYMFFGTSELQPWNDAEIEEKGEELEKLRSVVDETEYIGTTSVIAGQESGRIFLKRHEIV